MSAAHAHGRSASERAMWIAFALTGSFMLAEVAGGLITGSLALISDAAHMLTDTAALGIALFAMRVGRRPRDARHTFGHARVEILAAAFNAAMLFAVAFYIFYEAIERLRQPVEVQSLAMLGIATLGLVVNLISMRLLAGGKEASLNVRGAYLEVWSDMLGSLGVIAGALLIRFTGWTWVDPLIAVAIALWVLPRTWTLLRESVDVLMESTPARIDLAAVEKLLRADEDVLDIHDLHLWSIGSGQISLSAHVLVQPRTELTPFLAQMRGRLAQTFDIHHSTLQCEYEPCGIEVCFEDDADDAHAGAAKP